MRKRPHFSSNRNGQNNNQNGGYGGGNGGGQGGGQNRGRRRPHNGGHNGGHRQHNHGGGEGEFVSPRQVQAAKNNREKYINQARDAMSSGDRVKAEYYYQHADHYQRILNLADEQQAAQRQEQGHHRSHAEDDNHNDGGDYGSDHQNFEGERSESPDIMSHDQGDAPQQSHHREQPRQQHNRGPRRPYRQDYQSQPQQPQEGAVEHEAVEVAPQERVERQPRAPRQPRQPRVPREPQLDFDDNHGSQLEALLPAPKDI